MTTKLAKNKKGFTLVELIVVIAILGVLMAVLVPQYIQYVEKSKVGTDESTAGEVAHAMEIAAALTDDADAVITITSAGATLTGADADLTAELGAIIALADCKTTSKTYSTGITVSLIAGNADWTKKA